MTKFKVGDRVTIINYGHIGWIHKEEFERLTRIYGPTKLKIIHEEDKMLSYDLRPELLGEEAVITKAIVTQGIDKYSLAFDKGSISWFTNDQLKLKENESTNT
jgi:hypothetical protein